MKFTVNREQLIKPLQQVASVVEKRQTLPVLSNVLMEVENNQLVLTGTDLEIELIATVPLVSQEDSGAVTVPARKLLDICKSLPADALLSFSLEDERLTLVSGKGRYNLLTLPAADFPSLDAESFTHQVTLPTADVRHIIDKTSFSMALQDVRYYLNGMLLVLSNNEITAVTTDGHRLALSSRKLANNSGVDNKQIILPRKGVLELVRILADTGENVSLQFSSNHLRVETPALRFTSKLVDGKFPDYDRVIPKNNTVKVVLDTEVFKQALSRVMVLSNEKYRGSRLSFSAGTLELQTNNPEQEEAKEEISAEFSGSTPLEIGFNITYLLDILNNVESNRIVVNLSDNNGSALVHEDKDQDTAAPETVYVVMPMRL